VAILKLDLQFRNLYSVYLPTKLNTAHVIIAGKININVITVVAEPEGSVQLTQNPVFRYDPEPLLSTSESHNLPP
jgi:hypothetical protein